MSTTKSPAVALDYAGGAAAKGSIFAVDFDMSSRGAAVQWLSQCVLPRPAFHLASAH